MRTRLAGPALTLLGLIFMPTVSRGQLYTPDPYDPSGRAFRGYVYPGGGDGFNPAFTQRARNNVAPNQFDLLSDGLDMPGGRFGGRYDNAFRRFDADFDRVYIPNRRADEKYVEDRDQRERDQISASRERDPRKRAQLMREVEQESRKGTPEGALSVRRGSGGAPVATAPSRRASTRAANVSAPSRRRAPSAAGESAPSRARTNPSAAAPRSSAAPAPSRTRTPGASNPLPSEVLRRAQEREAAGRPAGESAPSSRPR